MSCFDGGIEGCKDGQDGVTGRCLAGMGLSGSVGPLSTEISLSKRSIICFGCSEFPHFAQYQFSNLMKKALANQTLLVCRVFNKSERLAKFATYFSLEVAPNFTNTMRNICTEHEPWIQKVCSQKNKREARILSNFGSDFGFPVHVRDEAHTFLGEWSSSPVPGVKLLLKTLSLGLGVKLCEYFVKGSDHNLTWNELTMERN